MRRPQAPLEVGLVLSFVLPASGCGEGDLAATGQGAGGAADAGDPDAASSAGDAGPANPASDALRPGPRADARPASDPDATGPGPAPDQGPPDPDAAEPPGPDLDAGPRPCAPAGTFACPVRVAAFPFSDTRDTRDPADAPSDAVDAYACRPDARETGPEVVYIVHIAERGLLSARLDDTPAGGPDIDLHLLDAPDPDACLIRDNIALSRTVDPGDYYLLADTWADADGVEYAGAYTLTVDFRPLAGDLCALQDLDVAMVWRSCAPGVDCYEGEDAEGVTRRFLRTPTTGPVVKEAHLVTVADDFGGGWPGSFTEGIDAHYALSEAESGHAMDRREPWAPAGEGGSEFGQGSYGRPLPVLDEAWYVNMYWRRPPPPGTRILLRNPETGAAVVAAGGYETGPGDNSRIGGVTEEVHHHLGTGHLSVLLLGFLVDQTLPLGPIDCD